MNTYIYRPERFHQELARLATLWSHANDAQLRNWSYLQPDGWFADYPAVATTYRTLTLTDLF